MSEGMASPVRSAAAGGGDFLRLLIFLIFFFDFYVFIYISMEESTSPGGHSQQYWGHRETNTRGLGITGG